MLNSEYDLKHLETTSKEVRDNLKTHRKQTTFNTTSYPGHIMYPPTTLGEMSSHVTSHQVPMPRVCRHLTKSISSDSGSCCDRSILRLSCWQRTLIPGDLETFLATTEVNVETMKPRSFLNGGRIKVTLHELLAIQPGGP